MKPVAIGRKNWLFAGSTAGGKTAAILMSLCTTCKNLKVDPLAYLTDVLGRVALIPPAGSRSCCRTAGRRCVRQPRWSRVTKPTELPDGGTLPVEVDRWRPGVGRIIRPRSHHAP